MKNTTLEYKKSYLKRKKIDIFNLSEEDIIINYEKIFLLNQKNGQDKRVKKLKESGKYDERIGLTFECTRCENEFIFKPNSKANKNIFCCYNCYKNSGVMALNWKKSILLNLGINISNLTPEQISEKHSEIITRQVNKSQPKRVATIKKFGSFRQQGIKGKNNYRKKFLIENCLVSGDNILKMNDEEIDLIFLKFFNKIEKRGEKIKNGQIKKHGDSKNVSKAYREAFYKTMLKKAELEGIDISMILKEDIDNYISKVIKERANKYPDRVFRWKRTHLINIGLDVENMDRETIFNEFTNYMSKRLILTESINNGYRGTLKGWYNYKNIDKTMFYRSSWEKNVFEHIDYLISLGKILNVMTPKRIEYKLDNTIRHYYPDVSYIISDGREITCEIKPKSKLLEKINSIKINTAKKEFENFIILTEEEIFSNDIEEYILITIKNNN